MEAVKRAVELDSESLFLDAATLAFYRQTLLRLNELGFPYLVGGAYAYARYTGIARHTKDFDIFIRRDDYERISSALADAGLRTELTHPHWLGKAFSPQTDAFIDLIFSGGNGEAVVDDEWFDHAVDETVFGIAVRLCPAEEIIWSKSFVQERERFDGADIHHLLLARAEKLDWGRLLRRFGEHWRVLLSHLVTFGFVYPGERGRIPADVMGALLSKLEHESSGGSAERKICRGTLISRAQYLTDVHEWGFEDGRLEPLGKMAKDEIEHWTAAIEG